MNKILIPLVLVSFFSCGNEPIVKPLPKVGFEQLYSVEELDEDFSFRITFTIDNPSDSPIGFDINSEDNTASAISDFYAITNQSISIQPGETSAELSVTIIGDDQYEAKEEFYLNLSNPRGLTLSSSKITVIIRDNDEYQEPQLTIPQTGFESPLTYEGYELLWQDEFDTQSLDMDKWNFDIGGQGWGNNEWQYYTDRNHYFKEGNLIIEAKREIYQGNNYTSSRLKTQGKFDFTYGRVDVRAALPHGQGIWPAVWMLGANISSVGWPRCGEIDIMEMIGGKDDQGNPREKTVHGTLHWANVNQDHAYIGGHIDLSTGSFQDEFHVFSIIWDTDQIRWLMDDQQFYSKDISSEEFNEFDLPHFILLNLAVGGNWPGYPDTTTEFPQRLIVDYVRVFTPK